MLTSLQLHSVHHNPSCDGVGMCTHDAEKKKDNAERKFAQ